MANPTLNELNRTNSLYSPGLSNFKDFSTYSACCAKYKLYLKNISRLNSCTVTGRVNVVRNRKLLRPMLTLQNELVEEQELADLNVDLMISKITEPKIRKIPKSLAVTFTKEEIYTTEGMEDIFDPNDATLSTVDELTDSASEDIAKLMEEYLANTSATTDEVERSINHVMGTITSQGDYDLFQSLDRFQKFVDDTKYINLYRDWKDMYNSLDTNCTELRSVLPNDDFLYYDAEHTSFIMPIDINTGKLRIKKFFEDLTPSEKRQADLIEKRYYKYLQDRSAILSDAAQKVRDKGTKDDKNPFAILYNNMKDNPKATVNTLF